MTAAYAVVVDVVVIFVENIIPPTTENDFWLDVVIVKIEGSVNSNGNHVIQNPVAKDSNNDDDADCENGNEEDCCAAMVLRHEVACNHVEDRHDAVIVVVNKLHCHG